MAYFLADGGSPWMVRFIGSFAGAPSWVTNPTHKEKNGCNLSGRLRHSLGIAIVDDHAVADERRQHAGEVNALL